ncbi:methyl-accepting chemotaxis protein [Desulfococcaceae bacterium HSG8]|nr:methyl-accepting chemotaxis protein [Desulfococcaceae bacterium HSG8]
MDIKIGKKSARPVSVETEIIEIDQNTPPVLVLSAPVFNADKEFIGSVRVGVTLRRISAERKTVTYQLCAWAIFLVLTGFLFSFVLARSISGSLNEMIGAINQIVQSSDLTKRIKAKGNIVELNRLENAFNIMIGRLKKSENELVQHNERLKTVLDQASIAIDRLMNVTLKEISAVTDQNSADTDKTHHFMNASNKEIAHANETMEKLTTSMKKIAHASSETSQIVKTIDDVAFQTNLLALNASVEAARAGDAGAGFAVVANEVRNLALRASEAAKNTADLISVTVTKVEGGETLVFTAAQAFSDISSNVLAMGELIERVAGGSVEQSRGIEQITQTVKMIDQILKQVHIHTAHACSSDLIDNG